MFELVHFIISNTCTVMSVSSTSSEYEHLVNNGTEAQNYGVQTFDKYD